MKLIKRTIQYILVNPLFKVCWKLHPKGVEGFGPYQPRFNGIDWLMRITADSWLKAEGKGE